MLKIRSYFSLGNIVSLLLLFILLYVPALCLGTAFRELGRFYGTVMMVFQMVLSWSVAVLYFQITLGKSMLWISVSIALLLLMSLSFWFIGKQQKKEFK